MSVNRRAAQTLLDGATARIDRRTDPATVLEMALLGSGYASLALTDDEPGGTDDAAALIALLEAVDPVQLEKTALARDDAWQIGGTRAILATLIGYLS